MGDEPILKPFQPEDSFLRRVGKKRYLRDGGEVSFEAFRPRDGEASLSFTWQDESLRSEEGLDEYQRNNALRQSADLPGLCRLTFHDLTVSLSPPLPPRHDPDNADPRYGHLHCATDLPCDELHMEKMAKLATRNGLVRLFVRARRK
ncbi:MAG: hypothetical protein HUU22_05645 [Phycisphaerae bacterium]|nr:hypothetical protein [Phycisphaerae bacterium]NUQ45496.1 hypothetical protein [Phycisphaerae bacterium]